MQQVTCHTHGRADVIFIPCENCVGTFCESCEYGYHPLCALCASCDFLWAGGQRSDLMCISALDVLLEAEGPFVTLIYWPKHSSEPMNVWTRDATDVYQEFVYWAEAVLVVAGMPLLLSMPPIWVKAQMYSEALTAIGIDETRQDAEFERLLLKFAPVPERHKTKEQA